MPYFLNYFSNLPKDNPFFEPINKDGSKHVYPHTDNYGLIKGYELNETSSPAVQDLFKIAILKSAHKSLPSVFFCGGYICLDNKLRCLIEGVEGEIHQFIPVTLLRKNRTPFGENYYFLNIRIVLDTIIVEKSNLVSVYTPQGAHVYTGGHKRPDFRTLDLSKSGRYHLWREKAGRRDIYLSDYLWETIKAGEISGFSRDAVRRTNEF